MSIRTTPLLSPVAVLALLAAPGPAAAECFGANGAPVELKGSIRVVRFQPDDGGTQQECRVLALDPPVCLTGEHLGAKRMVKELQLLPGTASAALPSSGRFVVAGTLAPSECRDVALEVSSVSAFAALEPPPAPGGKTRESRPAGPRKPVRLGYGSPDKVVAKMAAWNSPMKAALQAQGLTPTRVEYYRDGTYPVFFVKEDAANVPLLTLQHDDPVAADAKARVLLQANGDAPFEIVCDGERFQYDATRARAGAGFLVVYQD